MNTPIGMETDHINGNRLDNRRCNLRICTIAENTRNRIKVKGRTSQYKGVSREKRILKKPWRASIDIDGKTINLGAFYTEIEAALAYNENAKKYFGEFARLNRIC